VITVFTQHPEEFCLYIPKTYSMSPV